MGQAHIWFGVIGLAVSVAGMSAPTHAVNAEVPVVTDSRIRTLVYSPNEVFTVVAHYGFQSNIEFAPGEEIETISLGDQVAWQIVPAGRHIFIRPLTKHAVTNMTVITTRRIYNFDLKAKAQTKGVDESLSYVTRFYYPDDHVDALAAAPAPVAAAPVRMAAPAPMAHSAAPMLPPPPPPMALPMQRSQPEQYNMAAAPVPKVNVAPVMAEPPRSMPPVPVPMATDMGQPDPIAAAAQPFNFNYSLSGAEQISPVKVFDDGRQTFLQFTSPAPRRFFMVDPTGAEIPLPVRQQQGFTVVPLVASKIIQRMENGDIVCIFNDQISAPMNMAGAR